MFKQIKQFEDAEIGRCQNSFPKTYLKKKKNNSKMLTCENVIRTSLSHI